MLEKVFEGAIWRSRFIVILAVVFGLLGAFILFIVASMDIWGVAVYTFNTIITTTTIMYFLNIMFIIINTFRISNKKDVVYYPIIKFLR